MRRYDHTKIRENSPEMINFETFEIFKNCDSQFFTSLNVAAKVKSYEKGKLLVLHEDHAEHFFIIQSGWVKLFRETLDGTQSIVDVLPAGHIFGETSIFQDDKYPYTVEVIETAQIISFPLSLLKTEIESNNKLALSMLGAMTRYRRQQDQEIEHRTIQSAPQRIGCFLLRLADQDETGPVTIHLPYDKSLVASRLGMQPETFSRALLKLRDQTGIRVKGATIEMDSLEQLTGYSCAACSSEFPCKDLQQKA